MGSGSGGKEARSAGGKGGLVVYVQCQRCPIDQKLNRDNSHIVGCIYSDRHGFIRIYLQGIYSDRHFRWNNIACRSHCNRE